MPSSTLATDELRNILGKDGEAIIPVLAEIVGSFPAIKDAFKDDCRGEWQKQIDDLRRLASAVRTASENVRLAASGERSGRRDLFDDVAQLLEAQILICGLIENRLSARIARLERILELPSYRKRRGQPRNEPRYFLANWVAYLFQRAGIPLRKTHGGRFHAVLSLVIEAAEGVNPPEDLFPLIQETVNLFRSRKHHLDVMDLQLIGLARLPRPGQPDCTPSGATNLTYFARPVHAHYRPKEGG